MKKILLSIIAITAFIFQPIAQNVTIPDANFKNYLVGNNAINTNGDTEIQVSEASAFTGQINCGTSGISDLTGLEYFTSLTDLRCHSNNLTSLDVSQNTALTILGCAYNAIDTLDLTNNTALTILNCASNNLLSLDISPINGLYSLKCNLNSLEYLNVANGNNSNFTVFEAANNSNLNCIQVDNPTWSATHWTNIDAASSFNISCGAILVNTINIQGLAGQSTITNQAGTLQMEATVLPANADDDTFTWGITNQTGSATISPNGILTAISDGTVTVTAIANDASGTTGSTVITISNQSLAIKEQTNINNLSIYPNPVKNQLNIVTEAQVNTIEIYNFFGEIIQTETTTNFSVENLSKGTYLIRVKTNKGIINKRFVRN